MSRGQLCTRCSARHRGGAGLVDELVLMVWPRHPWTRRRPLAERALQRAGVTYRTATELNHTEALKASDPDTRNITVGATTVSDGSSLAPFDSPTEIKPISVKNWNVRLIGINEQHSIALQVEFDGAANLTLGRARLAPLSVFPKVVAVVAYDEPTEQVNQYAPYTLTVNGVVQPGGGGA